MDRYSMYELLTNAIVQFLPRTAQHSSINFIDSTCYMKKLGLLHKTLVSVPPLPRYVAELYEKITRAVDNVDSIMLSRETEAGLSH
ncbi:hypothetical protein TNCV_2048461 [Trichonephila clavipes]|nr:hypothetical protein TNCV_2048461 [Trichonephila clavipes]